MRKLLLVAGLALVVGAPGIASASMRCEREAHDNRVAGTIIGGVAGGLIGSAASHGSAGGAAIGAVGGAVIGNRLADASTHCPRGYVARYYDDPRPAYDYGTDSAYSGYDRDYGYDYDNAYSDSDYRRYWRDDRGRWCHWEDRTSYDYDGDVRHNWVQACSWR